MFKIINKSLQKIAKGVEMVFIGTIIGMLLGSIDSALLYRVCDSISTIHDLECGQHVTFCGGASQRNFKKNGG